MQLNTVLIQRFTQYWFASDLQRQEQRRARRVLLLSGLLMLVTGFGWGLFFAVRGDWAVVGLDFVLVLVVLALNWQKLARSVVFGLFLILLGVLILIAFAYDMPTAQVPRATHMHLLPLSVMALMAFRNEPAWLRHGVALLCLLAFVLLAADPGLSTLGYGLPDDVRRISAWVNPASALLNLYVLIYFLQTDATGRSRLEDELRQALAQQEFELHYQPQVDIEGHVTGCEALLRWLHPERGWVPPGEFVNLAEQTGLMLPIGQWAMEVACAQLQVWSSYKLTRHLSLAVNVSQTQFRQPDFVEQVLAMVDRYNIDASLLELEMTETMLVKDVQDIIDKMAALRARGIKFSLDDFGTGFSSLSYLKRLPLNKLKIDQSFVRDVLTDVNDAAIVRMVLALGQSLSLDVVAEGVETEGQRQFLLDHGCQRFQGHLYSHALPIAAFNSYVVQHNVLETAS